MNPTVDNLIILDLETSGLSPVQDRILEIAILPVDIDLQPLHEGWSRVVTPTGLDLSHLSPVVQKMHTDNGLFAALEKGEAIGIPEATRQAVRYCEQFGIRGQLPMTGSSIRFDRSFLERYMPELDAWFFYRIIDVSSLKELVKRFLSSSAEPEKGDKPHRALGDCYGTLKELQHYKRLLFDTARDANPDLLGLPC